MHLMTLFSGPIKDNMSFHIICVLKREMKGREMMVKPAAIILYYSVSDA